ncbi:MAG TPA: hypothetical protein VNE58_09520 [Casimicrobiaceae bacterium]|nr:hypothetical protein [Casimicrobiaceae bacterium]
MMLVIESAADAAGKRIDVPIQNGTRLAGRTDWLENGHRSGAVADGVPLDLPPNSVLDTHFHRENQFQLFVTGEGRIGRYSVRPLTVHYAGAGTGYGRWSQGRKACRTSRSARCTTPARGICRRREDLVRGPKRSLHSEPSEPLVRDTLRSLAAPVVIDPIALQSDGIAAQLIRLPPRTLHTIEIDPASGAGQFLIVIAGPVAVNDRAFSPFDVVFASRDESPFRLLFKDDGAEVIVLQTPEKDVVYVGHGTSHATAKQKSPPLGE